VVTGKVVEKQGRLIVDDLVNNRPSEDSFEANLPGAGLSVGSDYDDPDNPEGGYDVTSISSTRIEIQATRQAPTARAESRFAQVATCNGSRSVIIRRVAGADLHFASADARLPSSGELEVVDAADNAKRVLFRFPGSTIQIDEDDNGSFETTLNDPSELPADELCRETGAR
jgi:hypothetical protein